MDSSYQDVPDLYHLKKVADEQTISQDEDLENTKDSLDRDEEEQQFSKDWRELVQQIEDIQKYGSILYTYQEADINKYVNVDVLEQKEVGEDDLVNHEEQGESGDV